MTMKLVRSYTVTTSTSEVVFSNIPQTGDDLIIYLKVSDVGANNYPGLKTNGAYSTITDGLNLYQALSTGGSGAIQTGITSLQFGPAAITAFVTVKIVIKNYSTVSDKSISAETYAWDYLNITNRMSYSQITGLFKTPYNAAITSCSMSSASLAVGSTIQVYTYTKGSGGATATSA